MILRNQLTDITNVCDYRRRCETMAVESFEWINPEMVRSIFYNYWEMERERFGSLTQFGPELFVKGYRDRTQYCLRQTYNYLERP